MFPSQCGELTYFLYQVLFAYSSPAVLMIVSL